MNNLQSLHRMSSNSHYAQQGIFKLMHALLIVVIVVGLVVLFKTGKLQGAKHWPSDAKDWLQEQRDALDLHSDDADEQRNTNDTTPHKVTRPKETTHYTDSGRFAVQLAAGYDSRQLYALRDSLINDHFDAYLVSLNTTQGLLLKLRVGNFKSHNQAEKLRERLQNRYPEQGLFADSFIVEGN